MRLIDRLREDHAVIDDVLGALCAYADRRRAGHAPPGDAARFLDFLHVFAGDDHHAAEEEVLFPAMAAHLDLPLDRGPLAALLAQHRALGSLLSALDPWLREDDPRAPEAAGRYARLLGRHIDAENSVLLPEAEARLPRAGVRELLLPVRTAAAEAALRDAADLVARYPRAADPLAWRGEGCVVCPSFGVDCEGLEREWWNEFEWEEFADHLG